MEINEKSWHFRLVRHTAYHTARNIKEFGGSTLCQYFWLVVYAVLVSICKIAMTGFLLWLLIYQPVSYIWAPDEDKLALVLMWAAILTTTGLVFTILFIRDKLSKRNSSNKTKNPNIVAEYLRSKKQKFCPVIKIVK